MTENRVIMVNGATGGIGGAVAKRLVRNGYLVSLGARRNIDDPTLLRAIDDGNAYVGNFEALEEESAMQWVKDTVEWRGGIDGLVNCVGTLSNYNFLEDIAGLDAVIAVNVKGPVYCMKHAYPFLKMSKNPKIINMISLSGLRVVGRSAGYAASKFALRAISHSVRFYGWDDGVRVTALCPGWVNTDMVREFANIPEHEMIQPDDLAEVVAFLLELPKTASIGELVVNPVLEPYF